MKTLMQNLVGWKITFPLKPAMDWHWRQKKARDKFFPQNTPDGHRSTPNPILPETHPPSVLPCAHQKKNAAASPWPPPHPCRCPSQQPRPSLRPPPRRSLRSPPPSQVAPTAVLSGRRCAALLGRHSCPAGGILCSWIPPPQPSVKALRRRQQG